jgi:extradiol dioxygenase family protein
MSARLTPFHVAVQVRDIAEARNFYGQILAARKAAAIHIGSISIFMATNSSVISTQH